MLNPWNLYESSSNMMKSIDKEEKFQDPGYFDYDHSLFIQSNQSTLNIDSIDPLDLWYQQYSYRPFAYQFTTYHEEIAYQCQLLPFSYQNKIFITVNQEISALNENDEPYLTAYMYLTPGFIHPKSSYFTHPLLFQQLLGIDVVHQMISQSSI